MTTQNDPKIIFHIGYPKTASTTLQTHVFPYLTKVAYIGKHYDTARQQQRDLCNRLRHCPDEFSLNDKVTQGIVTDLKNTIAKSEKPILISYEEVMAATLHPAVGQGRFGRALPVRSAAHQFSYLHDLVKEVGGVTPKILIVVREQSELLPSFYAEAYKATFSSIRGMKSFSGYVDELLGQKSPLLDPASLDYCRVEDASIREFGVNNVKLIPYAWMASDVDRFVRDVSDFIECDEGEFRRLLAGAKRENVRRLSGGRTGLKSDRKSVADCVSLFKRSVIPNVRLGVGAVLYPALSRLTFGRAEVVPTDREFIRIKDFYRESNVQFVQRHPEFAFGDTAAI